MTYKLATHQSGGGPRAGMVVNDRVYDVATVTGRPGYVTVLGVLHDWPVPVPPDWVTIVNRE